MSLLFGLLAGLRRALYSTGALDSRRLPVPVIIVGNISVGGTGKTPFTTWLIDYLRGQGWRPGIVSRGYGSTCDAYPLSVDATSDAAMTGDEPLLLAQRCQCPVMIDPNRVRAAEALLAQHNVDIIVSDDGLQHYALQRDVELVVVDAKRRFGNQLLLPAGPLRESVARLRSVDAVLFNGANDEQEAGFTLKQLPLQSLAGDEQLPLSELVGRQVHAVAGIGNPQRFFALLEQAGLRVQKHAFADHHPYSMQDIDFNDELPVLMTEKDAVKCRSFANQRHWYLPVTASPNAAGKALIDQALSKLRQNEYG